MTWVSFRLSEEEKELLEKRATKLGVTRSEYIRQMVLQGFVINHRNEVIQDLVVAVNRIGVNINQIARVCNETRNVYASELEKLQIDFLRLYKLMEKSLSLREEKNKMIEVLSARNL